MAPRDERQTVDRENVIPTRDPTQAVARLEREIRNGTVRDRIDLDVALRSWEYRFIPETEADRLTQLLPEEASA